MGRGHIAQERGHGLPVPRLIAAVIGAVLVVVASPARRAAAQEDHQGEIVTVPPVTLEEDASAEEVCTAVRGSPAALARLRRCLRRPQLTWQPQWSRAGLGDAIVFGVSIAAGATLMLIEPPKEPRWTELNVFDRDGRDALVLSDRDARERASLVSDQLLALLLVYPFAIDGVVMGLMLRDSRDWAIQMMIISAVSYSITYAVTFAVKVAAGRERPYLRGCAADSEYHVGCDLENRDRNAAYISGHTSMAFTAAGLMCAHHIATPIHGAPAADIGVCVGGLAAASAVGILRMVSDAHWATDVISGAAVGLLSGWLLPTIVRYQSWNPEAGTGGVSMIAIPQIGPGQAGMGIAGTFL